LSDANPYLQIDQQMVGDIYTSSEPMDNLTVLCDDYGSRFGGTEGERQAAEMFVRKFKEYGLKRVKKESFPFAAWTRGAVSLEVTSPVRMEIPCIALPYCPSATMETEMVFVGDGAPADFEAAGRRMKGRVVMATSRSPSGLGRNVHRSEKYARSALAGAAGFIFANHYEGLGPATGSIADNREALIPGISVSKEWGDYLIRLQHRKGPLTLRLKTRNRTRQKRSWNVLADLPGTRWPDQWMVIGCHYDGHDISQGAHDPASGMVVALEAARVLSRYASDALGCSLRFVAFGVEEIGLIGAREYVEAHLDEMPSIRFMLNLDAAGGKNRKGVVLNHVPEMEPLLNLTRSHLKVDLPVGQKLIPFSDHYPFFEEGVPTAMMGDSEAAYTGRGFGHTAFDTLDKVRLSDLQDAAAVVSRLALRVSNEAKWPAKTRSAARVARIKKAEPSLAIIEVEERLDRLYRRKGRGHAKGKSFGWSGKRR